MQMNDYSFLKSAYNKKAEALASAFLLWVVTLLSARERVK